ncbi:MAG: hypothetical protein WC737_03630 [Parcubacteria group bacterium]|jgi:hypothetical protein
MKRELSCKTGLKKNILSKTVFEREICLCKKLNKESRGKGCRWGKCKNCGVIPLLYKLYKGVLIEDKKELQIIKNKLFF